MFSFLNRRQRDKVLASQPIAHALWQQTSRLPLLRGLNADELALLRQQVTWFLHDRVFTPANGAQLDDEQRLTIAVQCCLPLLNLGFDCLDDWREVIVYPGEFVSRNRTYESVSEYLGVVHESVSISWPDKPVRMAHYYCHGSTAPNHPGWMAGNVPIHEISTHKLDMRSGDANGCPPLHAGMVTKPEETFSKRLRRPKTAG